MIIKNLHDLYERLGPELGYIAPRPKMLDRPGNHAIFPPKPEYGRPYPDSARPKLTPQTSPAVVRVLAGLRDDTGGPIKVRGAVLACV